MMIVQRKTTVLYDGIGSNDLLKDGLHLLDSGKQSLTNNYYFQY